MRDHLLSGMSTFRVDSSMAKSRFNDDYDYLFTVLIIGDEAVGKSSLVQRYIEGTFTGTKGKPTIGIDFSLKYLITNGHKILLQLWDSSGQEKYRNLVKHFFTKMMGIIIVLDITNTKSLSALGGWIEEARKHAHPETQVGLKELGHVTVAKPVIFIYIVAHTCPLSSVKILVDRLGESTI